MLPVSFEPRKAVKLLRAVYSAEYSSEVVKTTIWRATNLRNIEKIVIPERWFSIIDLEVEI